MFTCKLCNRVWQTEDQLVSHFEVEHNLNRDGYLAATNQDEIAPDVIDTNEWDEPTEAEKEFLTQWAAEGLDPADQRLHRVAFIAATLKRKEADIRSKEVANISSADLEKLRPLYKEVRDTIESLRREKRLENEGKESQDLLSEALLEAEKFMTENQGDFQFRCGNCGHWVQTDGADVWMLFQEKDPDNPDRLRIHVGNKEIFWLVRQGNLPLSLAAFILRTSPEGLQWTAKQRGLALVPVEDEIEHLARSEAELQQLRAAFDL